MADVARQTSRRSDRGVAYLAKKDTTEPTSLMYDQALDESLRIGWIDGQARCRDESTYQRRLTPRRALSVWSRRNDVGC